MKPYSQLTVASYIIGPTLIVVSHLGTLLILFTGLSGGAITWAVLLYVTRMLATTGIYHRLLTHKSYQAPKPVLWIGSIVASAAGQMGPSWWKAHHTAHHQFSDEERDAHSPYQPFQGARGFWWSQIGWLFSSEFLPAKLPSDVESDIVLRTIDRLHFLPTLMLGAISYAIGSTEYLAAFFLSTTVLFHCVATVNSLAHLAGEQPFLTNDHSRNNRLVAFLTFGEGWHNSHHAFQSSARHGITLQNGQVAYLPDPTFWLIELLELFNLASNVRVPSETELINRAKDRNHQALGLNTSIETLS